MSKFQGHQTAHVRCNPHTFARRDIEMTASNASEANKALVLAGIKGAFIDRDPAVLDRLFRSDYHQHNPLIANGTAAIKAIIAGLSPDFRYEPGLVVADGEYVMIQPVHRMGPEAVGCGQYIPRRQWQDCRTLGCHAGRGPSNAKRQWP